MMFAQRTAFVSETDQEERWQVQPGAVEGEAVMVSVHSWRSKDVLVSAQVQMGALVERPCLETLGSHPRGLPWKNKGQSCTEHQRGRGRSYQMTSQTIHIYHQQGNGRERIFSLEGRNSSFFLHLQENHQREKHP